MTVVDNCPWSGMPGTLGMLDTLDTRTFGDSMRSQTDPPTARLRHLRTCAWSRSVIMDVPSSKNLISCATCYGLRPSEPWLYIKAREAIAT
jgi:hypothetical protein